jgi:hypothetical protein
MFNLSISLFLFLIKLSYFIYLKLISEPFLSDWELEIILLFESYLNLLLYEVDDFDTILLFLFSLLFKISFIFSLFIIFFPLINLKLLLSFIGNYVTPFELFKIIFSFLQFFFD